jgi:hypothetical protein
VSVACSEVEVSVMGQSLIQRSPTKCGVSEWDLKTSMMMRPGPTRAGGPRKEKNINENLTMFFVTDIFKRNMWNAIL